MAFVSNSCSDLEWIYRTGKEIPDSSSGISREVVGNTVSKTIKISTKQLTTIVTDERI